MESTIASEITSSLNTMATIGIGAGVDCDGQVLVTHDVLGLFERFTPRFVKKYAHFHQDMTSAFGDYIRDVKNKDFPTPNHSIEMPDEEWESLLKKI